MVTMDISRPELVTIENIVARAAHLSRFCGSPLGMDGRRHLREALVICHANGCPLRLDALARAPEHHFIYDVFGIRRHLLPETGQLEPCFRPRFAQEAP